MNDIIFQLHSPEEFRNLSNLGHWTIGYILLGVAAIALLQTLGFLKTKPYLWPLLVAIAGIILIPYNLLHHGLNEFPLVMKVIEVDPQQRQHFIMFVLLFSAGVIELLLSLKKIKGKFWQFVWPGVLLIIGYMFLTHPQHGTADAQAYTEPFHTALGIVLLITGVLKGAKVIWVKRFKWLTYGWILFLLITAIMLIVYREPVGAYQMNSEMPSDHQGTMEH